MEKLIEVLKNRFKDIQIYPDNDMGMGGLLCRFNEETMRMAVFINTDYKWMIRYSPMESFDRWSVALGQEVLSEDIQSVIDWFSDDKNIIEMYEVSLQDLSEYCLQLDHTEFDWGIIVQSELADRKVVSYDSVMQILDKYK